VSHSRTKPAGWALNEQLTYAEVTDIDRKTAQSVDKTVAGDTIEGPITVANGAGIILESGAVLRTEVGSTSTVEGTVTVTGASGLVTTATGGRIVHGDNDYPELAIGHTGRSMTRVYSFAALPRAGKVTSAISAETVAAGGAELFVLPVHNGATLSSVEVRFVPTTPHVGLPATNLAILVQRRSNPVGGAITTASLYSGGGVSYTPVSHPIYDNGLIKQVTLTTDQNNVIDRETYVYELGIQGENSTYALPVFFLEVLLHFTIITDLRPA
jgi:hypothetical protein